ncbi:MAG: GNAT family N-acetyltransferase [Sneathiellaceae bacterium]
MTGRPPPETAPPGISLLAADLLDGRLGDLAALLQACVHAGASIGFILPFPMAEALAFWRDTVFPGVRAGTRSLLVAEEAGRIVGTVQLLPAQMPNQPHRAEVAKLMVHPQARRRGLARALMIALERRAAGSGRHLLTLDTRSGDAAEPLYTSLGYRRLGEIPGYCLHPSEPRLEATTIMYKAL